MPRHVAILLVLALPFSVAGTSLPRPGGDAETGAKKVPDRSVVLSSRPGASGALVIASPGTYRLDSDLKECPIIIAASDVALDLGGHALRPGGAAGNAIALAEGCAGVTIRNGVIAGWSGWGVSAADAHHTTLEDLTLRGNTGGGLDLGDGAFVRRCTAERNGIGLRASGIDAWITDNDLRGNTLGLDVPGTDNVLATNLADTSRIGGGNTVSPGL